MVLKWSPAVCQTGSSRSNVPSAYIGHVQRQWYRLVFKQQRKQHKNIQKIFFKYASKLIKYYTIIFKDALHKLNRHLSKKIELRKINKIQTS